MFLFLLFWVLHRDAKEKYKTHCKNGHLISDLGRYEGGHGCVACTRERAAIWAQNNPDKAQAIYKKYWSENAEREALKAKIKNIKRAGFTPELFAYTLEGQKGCCAVCKQPFTEKSKPCADHKHIAPPMPRGLLHRTCNSALGLLRESPDILRSAIAYLELWGESLSVEEYAEQNACNLSNFR